jgi:hypothetical protein
MHDQLQPLHSTQCWACQTKYELRKETTKHLTNLVKETFPCAAKGLLGVEGNKQLTVVLDTMYELHMLETKFHKGH